MEKNILYKNSHLQAIFEQSEMLYKAPLTISQVSFSKKTQVSDHILMLGDAAGMITPLCGNGMSMALHSAKLAHSAIVDFLESRVNRENMELNYQQKWRQQFAGRLATGRMIQSMFGREWVTNRFIGCMKLLPSVTGALIRRTHGLPF
jgi:flavin-dependent dehydrogenase